MPHVQGTESKFQLNSEKGEKQINNDNNLIGFQVHDNNPLIKKITLQKSRVIQASEN